MVHLMLAISMLVVALPTSAPVLPDALDRQVKAAVDRGVAFLRTQATQKGDWELDVTAGPYVGGQTALALLALLSCGVRADDPLIAKSLAYLRTIEPDSTYVVGLQTAVFAATDDKQDLPRIQRNVDWLVKARVLQGNNKGWSYRSQATAPDQSNTHYAVLGLAAGRSAGAKIDPDVWNWVHKTYTDSQVAASGGWTYRSAWGESLSITAAGLAGLLVTGLDCSPGRGLAQGGVGFAAGLPGENAPFGRALTWITKRVPRKPADIKRLPHQFYTLHVLGRASRLASERRLRIDDDWIPVAQKYFVDTQGKDGSWGAKGSNQVEESPVLSTAFALLFLTDTRPVRR